MPQALLEQPEVEAEKKETITENFINKKYLKLNMAWLLFNHRFYRQNGICVLNKKGKKEYKKIYIYY